MTRLGLGGVLLASAALAAAQPPPRQPFELAAVAAPRNTVDEAVFGRLARLRPHARASRVGRRVPPAGLPRRDRDAAHRRRGARVPRRRVAVQAQRAHRPPARTRRVRRLLGDEVGRRAPREVRVPDQPVAERGAGLPRVDPRRPARQHALRPLRASAAHVERQQLPRRRRSTSTAPSRAASRRPLPRAWRWCSWGRVSSRGPPTDRPRWPPSSRRSATSRRASGRRRSCTSTRTRPAAPRPAR